MPDRPAPQPMDCAQCRRPFAGRGDATMCSTCLLDGLLAAAGETWTAKSGEDWLDGAEEPRVSRKTADPAHFSSYELLGEIARGGMGIVYRARQLQPDRLVALKVLLPRQADATGMLTRFRAEAAIVASLDHPNLLPVYETGEHAGLPFFSMKLVDGGSLAGRIGEYAGRPRAAAQLVQLAAGAVHHAHQRGVLHRDLKPGNILLQGSEDPTPYVADFGIAKVLGSDLSLTLTHDVLGTPAYAAPEQASPGGAHVTIAADVYGLGAVLYELLAQRPPFTGATPLETLRKVVDEPPVPPRTGDPDIPRDLETICLKCLQKDPTARYASAAGLAADLGRFLAGESVLARAVPARERVWRWVRRNPALAALWTVLALFVIMVAVGSTAAAWSLEAGKTRAVRAEKTAVAARNQAIENLRASYLVGAHALRGGVRMGRRFEALALIKKAAAIRPGFDLRNEAIAALALTDVALERQWGQAKDNLYGPAAFDPTFQFCATELPGGPVSIWRFADRETVCKLHADDADQSEARTLGPWNGVHLPLVTQQGTVRVYRTDPAGQARLLWTVPNLCPPEQHRIRPGGIDISPDGKTLAIYTANAGGISLRDAEDGHELRRLAKGRSPEFVAFNADGSRLVFADFMGHEADRWNIAEDRQEKVYPSEDSIIAVTLSKPDNLVALGTTPSTIVLLDYASAELRQKLRCTGRNSELVAFHPTAPLVATTGRNRALNIWQTISGELLVTAPGFSAEPALRFSANGRQVAISPYDNNAIGAVQLRGYDCMKAVFPSRAGDLGSDCNVLDVSPDSQLFAVATRAGVWLGDLHTGQELAWWAPDPVKGRPRMTAQFTPDGRGLVVCCDVTGRWYRGLTWDGPSSLRWEEPKHLDDTRKWMVSSRPTRGGLSAFINDSVSDHLVIRPLAAPGPPDDPKSHFAMESSTVWQALLTCDGRYLATSTTGQPEASDPGCRVYDLATRRVVWERKIRAGITAAFSPGGHYFYHSVSPPSVLETGTWKEVFQVPYSTEWAEFSPDERIVAIRDESAQDNNPGVIRFFAVPSGEQLAVFETAADQMAFSPDGRYFLCVANGTPVQIWDLHAIRRELRALGLDWSTEPIPEPGPEPEPVTLHEP